jgi:hypothetical protein
MMLRKWNGLIRRDGFSGPCVGTEILPTECRLNAQVKLSQVAAWKQQLSEQAAELFYDCRHCTPQLTVWPRTLAAGPRG